MRRGGLLLAVTLGAILAAVPGVAQAASLQPIGSYTKPVFITSEPPNPDRLLIVEQGGKIRLTEGATTSLFLDISSLVGPGGEEGLLSMAPSPDYATNKRFYVFYVNTGGDLQIDEFTASAIPVDTATRRAVLTISHPTDEIHNGGQLQFGPDGYLYIATGDGGGGGDPEGNGQDLSSLLGKILRIDPSPGGATPFTIPPGNPFAGTTFGADEIWSYGLRNPFRFSFDRETGAIAIGDVGQASFEEIDYEPAPDAGRGDNFGWNCREGLHPYTTTPPDPSCAGATGFTDPIFEYSHSVGCSITGGYVVRDASLGDLYGRYLYADFCVGELRSQLPGPTEASCDRSEGLSVQNPSSFGEDSSGRIYVVSLTGPVYRLVGDTPAGCPSEPPPSDPPPSDPTPTDPATDPAPEAAFPEVGTGSPTAAPRDPDPPSLRLAAPDRQRLHGDWRLACRLHADQRATVVARLALIVRGEVVVRARKKHLELSPGATERVSWTLSRGEVRSLRRLLRERTLEARFRARAADSAGNPGPRVEAVSAVRG